MTAVGGMLLLAHVNSESSGLIPDSPSHWMGAIATVLSFVNICGGFLITGKMLDLFRSVNLVWHRAQFDVSVDIWLCVGITVEG
jgi:NAD(P) transhydrogenase